MATLVSAVVTAVQRQFGDSTGAMITQTDIIRWINEVQFQIARRTGDVISSTTLSVVEGDFQYDLPANYFKVISVDVDGQKIQYVTEAQLGSLYPQLAADDAPQGKPRFFTVQAGGTGGADIIFAPVPGDDYSVDVKYRSRPTPVDDPADNLSVDDLWVTTVVDYCVAKAKQLDGDDDAWAAGMQQFRQGISEDAADAREADDETYTAIRTSNGDYGYTGADWAG